MTTHFEPRTPGDNFSTRAAERLTDEELLRREADWALAAMRGTTTKIKQAAIQAVDPAAWAETHPWASVGAAAAAGFVAAKVLRTPREEKIIARYLKSLRQGAPASAKAAASAAQPRGWMTGLFSLVQTAAMQIPAILSQMQAADAARSAANAEQSASNGTTGGAASAAAAPASEGASSSAAGHAASDYPEYPAGY
ncbi:MAG: hypothetical protein C0483_01355 [Pirellula sp.]|nr:hypothetical protein [Pirellula sp.]